jgi:hypothetical protein
LDYFLHPALKDLGGKIVESSKLLGFVDLGVILSADDDAPLREKLFQLMMEALPTDDVMLEKIFADNIRQIKKKWYKEQKNLIQLGLRKAQESGNQELSHKLLQEKENILTKEKELR